MCILPFAMRITGLEPARRRHQILNLARLPIPPYPLIINYLETPTGRIFPDHFTRLIKAAEILQCRTSAATCSL